MQALHSISYQVYENKVLFRIVCIAFWFIPVEQFGKRYNIDQ